ncbi:nuclear transport factor 2 family protein, partial [Flavobacterium aquidurense]|uniref:nuclear transport factor 2 family protein n=1 Tax=Flavobacterium aquidurense TaxID=362413 RepID=UPI0037127128
IGKQRIGRFLADVLGGGRSGLLRDEIIHHIQLQLVITIDEDRQGASARGRALVQGNSPPGSGRLLLAEGIYENRYVRQGDGWRIKSLWWVPTYYFQVAGFDAAVFDSGPPSESFPPDLPSVPIDARLGRRFPPFHYPHPTTDAPAPASVASPEQMPAASAKAQA